jgi:hypothetical protein
MNDLLTAKVDRRGMLRLLGMGGAAVAIGAAFRVATASAAEMFGLSPITVRGDAARQGWRRVMVEVFIVAHDHESGKAVRRAERNIASGVADYVLRLSADDLSRNSRSVKRGIADAVMRSAPRGTLQDVKIMGVSVY